MKNNIDEAVKMYSGDKAYMVFVDKLEKNLAKFNEIYLEIKEIFESEGINDFSHLPDDISARVKFAHCFNRLNSMLEMVKVQDFTWKNLVYGDINVLITEETYLVLLQRYKELFSPSSCGGGKDVPYDLNPHITEIGTGKIDADYMNSRFEKFLKLKLDGSSKQNIERALQALYKSFAMLPENEQKFAEIFIKDVQLGNIIPDSTKTFRDYITQYVKVAKDKQIHTMANLFGLNENSLIKIMQSDISEATLDEFGRYGTLRDSADINKIVEYFEKALKCKISPFKAKSKFDILLSKFILEGGFDVNLPDEN